MWTGAIVGGVLAMLVTRRLRRYLLPALAGVILAGAAAFVLIPGIHSKFEERVNSVNSVYDRENLTVAGLNMVSARPLTGVGWSKFQADSLLYFQQSENYPINPQLPRFGIHNFLLSYAVELGLLGLALWSFGLILGVGSALVIRGPTDLGPWRVALLAVFASFLVIANSVPPSLFPNLSLWLLAGVVFSGVYAPRQEPAAAAGAATPEGHRPSPTIAAGVGM